MFSFSGNVKDSGKIEKKNFIRGTEKCHRSDHMYPPAAVYFCSLIVSFFLPASILNNFLDNQLKRDEIFTTYIFYLFFAKVIFFYSHYLFFRVPKKGQVHYCLV